jgi:threonyl-tRNA synthetase
MIHRAPFGSMERFVGVLIEHFNGAFPLWLSPEQVRVLPVSGKSDDYAKRVHAELKSIGVRAEIDLANDRVQGKIKNAAQWKVPYTVIVGPRDEEAGNVSLRAFGRNEALGTMPLGEFIAGIEAEIESKGAETIVQRFETAGA